MSPTIQGAGELLLYGVIIGSVVSGAWGLFEMARRFVSGDFRGFTKLSLEERTRRFREWEPTPLRWLSRITFLLIGLYAAYLVWFPEDVASYPAAGQEMGALLWTIQGSLSIVFMVVGVRRLLHVNKTRHEPIVGDQESPGFSRLQGALETLGGVGLIASALPGVPLATTPTVAIGLCALLIVRARRRMHRVGKYVPMTTGEQWLLGVLTFLIWARL